LQWLLSSCRFQHLEIQSKVLLRYPYYLFFYPLRK
tara:strand:+ start:33978 stop:34082 length:105 start_codon:yes stop_codon:yes gene_type:complete